MRFTTLGRESVRREFTREHIRRLHQWFDADGNFRHPGAPPSSRERLWNCFSLLQGNARSVRLANRIIRRTPIDGNHFLPITAAEVALRYPGRLTPAARAHLISAVDRHYVNMLEWRYGTYGMHNFVCMTTWFLLAAPCLLDRFKFDHEFASIPEVYSSERMKDIGRNALYLLAHEWERRAISNEFNSPTYSPISVMALAKIVELIPDPEVREPALEIEAKHWRELLALYHPRLSLPCGPYARAYRVDVLGQVSCMRMLMSYVGLSKDCSLAALFDDRHPDAYFHNDQDLPFNWSQAAWLVSTRYHVPQDARREFRHRSYPKRAMASHRWESFGLIDRKQQKLIPVHGTALPGGEADIVQVQHANWAIGYRSCSVFGHSFPIHLHYALTKNLRSMRDVRSVLCAVLFQNRPEEWTKDHRGQPIESGNFTHHGHLRVREQGDGLVFEGHPLEDLAALSTGECSVNTFIPTHFAPITDIRFNGQPFCGTALELRAKTATLEVNDHGFRYTVQYRFKRPTHIRLYRWARFLRFAGFWHAGQSRRLTPRQLAGMIVHGRLRVNRREDALSSS